MSDKNKKVICIFSLFVATVVTIYAYIITLPNAYEVYIGGIPVAIVENKEDFINVNESLIQDINKRYPNVKLNNGITFKKVKTNLSIVSSSSFIRKEILCRSNIKVPAITMYSDRKKIAVLANEKELNAVIELVKKNYAQKNNIKNLNNISLKSDISYIKSNVNLVYLDNLNDAAAAIINKSRPAVSFEYKDSLSAGSISRGGGLSVATMCIPTIGRITSNYGMRWGKMHYGVDIGAPYGSEIIAADNGTITYAEWEGGYGKLIVIQHSGGLSSYYGHCSSIDVKVGQFVKKGQKIGEIGSTGKSTGPHVHFEIRNNGKPTNPLNFIN
jgi:murein DD-endopeptidase MepM/ murein hydrolase activator NlpD